MNWSKTPGRSASWINDMFMLEKLVRALDANDITRKYSTFVPFNAYNKLVLIKLQYIFQRFKLVFMPSEPENDTKCFDCVSTTP